MRLLPSLFVLAVAAGAWSHFANRPVSHGAGEIAPAEPVQSGDIDLPPFAHGPFRVTPAAGFEIEARVLAIEKYHAGREAELSPLDLALGWGPMSDSAVLKRLEISQGNRFYFYRWQGQPPLPPAAIGRHSANMHMIPADDEVGRRLDALREGQVVALSGYLVRVRAPDGWHWNSSLSRDDTGQGACELVWVRRVAVRRGG